MRPYRRAVALQPSLMPAQANLGRALYFKGDSEGAIALTGGASARAGNARVKAMLAEARAKKQRQ